MNKTVFLTLALLATFFFAQAQETRTDARAPRTNIIKTSPFHLIEGTFLLSYERLLFKHKLGIMVSPGLNYRPEKLYPLNDGGVARTPEQGYQGELQLRAYIIRPALYSAAGKGGFYFSGLYAGPYLMHRYRERDVSNRKSLFPNRVGDKQIASEIAFGGICGAQICFANRLYLDFYLGLGYKNSDGKFTYNTSYQPAHSIYNVGYQGVIPKGGFQIGVGF